jgi:hypothetical protein
LFLFGSVVYLSQKPYAIFKIHVNLKSFKFMQTKPICCFKNLKGKRFKKGMKSPREPNLPRPDFSPRPTYLRAETVRTVPPPSR